MKLYEIPKNSKLKVTLDGETEMSDATFHRLDGMYSYCTLDKLPVTAFHLAAWTPMKKVGEHYEIDYGE